MNDPLLSSNLVSIREVADEMARHASLKRPGSMIGQWAERLQEALRSSGETSDEWLPIASADVSQMFASSKWVLIQRDDGFVTEAVPHFFGPDAYIWIAARGDNCRGSNDERSQMLRHSVTHWRHLPSPVKTPGEPT